MATIKTKEQKCSIARQAVRKIRKTLAGAMLVGSLMLGTSAHADQARGKMSVNMYDKAKTSSVALGIGKGFDLSKGCSVDASMALSSRGSTVDLESGELDLTMPLLGSVSTTLYVYKDRFYYVDRGYGAMLHVKNFHIAGEYVGDNWADAFAKYAFELAKGKVRLVPKAVLLFSDKRVEGIGAELLGEIGIGDVTLFAKITHSRIPQDGSWLNGNMQAGMGWKF